MARRSRRPTTTDVAIALGAGLAFWGPAFAVSRGWFPAPLDDVYIHFDFARALGQGHPFAWIAGQGYSSGETSPLYAVLLAMGWGLGCRGRALGVWAAILAVASVASLLGSVRRLTGARLGALPLSLGIVDWSLFSGMELAVFVAVLGRALEALVNVRARAATTFARREWALGAWGIALCWLRPESVVLVAVFAIAAARGAGTRSAVATIARVTTPGAAATLAILGLNRVFTGDARSAGAQLKLLSSNPYFSEVDRARVFVENLATFWVKVVRGELAARPALALVFLAFVLLGLVRRTTLASTCIAGAVGWLLLVSWNGNAPHHNFRYYVPALVLLSVAASAGLAVVPRGRAVVAALLFASGASRIPDQARHFRAACANIRDQHVEVATRLAALGPGARVLLGDAGVIPYVSGLPAVDALGLGGYLGVPFTHAAPHGEAATVELLERLSPALRPTHLALYPNWFGGITSRFGRELDRVTITNNVICGGTTKAIYAADWTPLGGPPSGDATELDVADVVDEEAHGYVGPMPNGGWTSFDVLEDDEGVRRFDAGRKIPEGQSESFTVAASGRVALVVRIDAEARGIEIAGAGPLALAPAQPGRWRSASITLDVTRGQRLTLTARGAAYRDYHLWLRPR